MQEPSAKSRYEALAKDREPYLKRGREAAKVTVPNLLPPEGSTGYSDFDTPYQSLGSRGVRTIASKLLLALDPPNSPCFKYSLDDFAIQKIAEGNGTRGEIEKALDKRARAVKTEMENTKFRPVAFESMRQLTVVGNYLLYIPPDPKEYPRGWRLTNYVVRRDPGGRLLELVIKEAIAFGALPEDVQAIILDKKGTGDGKSSIKPTDTFELYTHIRRRSDGKFEEYQEVEGEFIPDTEATYTEETLPYIPMRFTAMDGEHYGRSFIEEFLGDLITLDGLSQAIVEGAAIHSRVIFLVNPNGVTVVEDLQEAENGDFVEGDINEVEALQVQKQGDLQVAANLANEIVKRLSLAFMMYQAVQRDAERVTAEEIRKLTQELDDALGGVYSLLSVEFQLPVVRLYEKRMERAKNIPALPKKIDIKPAIVTGVEALGRAKDLNDLDNLVGSAANFTDPKSIGTVIDLSEYFRRRAVYLGIDPDGLIIDQSTQAQANQQEQLKAMLMQVLPQIVQQGGGMLKEQQKHYNEQQSKAQGE